MKQLIVGFLLFCMLAMAGMSEARSLRVHSYRRANGHYVQSYHRTWPNHTRRDNYSHIGNVNPWTGKRGHHRY